MLKSTKVSNSLHTGGSATESATSSLSTLVRVSVALASVALISCSDDSGSPPANNVVNPGPSGTDMTGTGAPVSPIGSVAPVNPTVSPVGVGPVGPTGGVSPVGSTGGVSPVSPVGSTGGVAPVTPTGSGTDVAPTSAPVSPTSSGGVNPVSPGGGDPSGYWRQDDWHGCVWTGIDDANAGTSITPQDFTAGVDEGYCVSGKVAATEGWKGVALLGFNLSQDPAGADCTYKPVDVNAEGPPAVTLTKAGLAINVVKRGADKSFTLRAQIQGPNGASDPNDRWCANVTEAQGKELLKWDDFYTECWGEVGEQGTKYNGQPISAIVFTVPGNGWAEGTNGNAEDIPYEFCINGFAAGDSAQDAPDGVIQQEDLTGTIGGTATGADYARVKVSAGGKSYVIQNNNWGNEAGAQTLSYVNNSFTVTDGPDEPASCQGCPLSFPSIYIGASGNTDNGKYHTRSTDNLPAAISAITSVNTSVRWSGNPGGGSNASYDIWFASPSRGDLTNKRYNDGLDGFIMLWLYDPNGQAAPMPIGGSPIGSVSINNIMWDVWVGPRGQGPSGEGADLMAAADAPVISYVARTTTNTFNGDLKPFFQDAIGRSGGGSKQFSADLLLTDVFFGFEIWNGGTGLKVDSFTIDVQK